MELHVWKVIDSGRDDTVTDFMVVPGGLLYRTRSLRSDGTASVALAFVRMSKAELGQLRERAGETT